MRALGLRFLSPVICLTSLAAMPCQAQTNDPRSVVILAASEALGAKPGTSLQYSDALNSARVTIDKAFYCAAKPEVIGLPKSVIDQVAARALQNIGKGEFASALSDRPAYVTDLIVTAISAFELGRVTSIPKSQQEVLCAPADAAVSG
jgi:hypothetical protein